MRTTNPDFDSMSPEAIIAAALSNITDDERRGGDYAVWAGSDRRLLAEHQVPAALGAACPACGEPWPCSVIRGLFGSD